ncbi:MAG: hypothetical protein IJW82_01170 [Clostridia bacterium]|nr:hypothetical protein [Clostridia bacterium]
MKNNEKFTYSYSAPTEKERIEIERIKLSYQSNPLSDFDNLKILNFKVKGLSLIFGISLGILGLLIFGFGLTSILLWNMFVFGIFSMIIGPIIMLINFPLYKKFLFLQEQKYKEKILTLTNKIINK